MFAKVNLGQIFCGIPSEPCYENSSCEAPIHMKKSHQRFLCPVYNTKRQENVVQMPQVSSVHSICAMGCENLEHQDDTCMFGVDSKNSMLKYDTHVNAQIRAPWSSW